MVYHIVKYLLVMGVIVIMGCQKAELPSLYLSQFLPLKSYLKSGRRGGEKLLVISTDSKNTEALFECRLDDGTVKEIFPMASTDSLVRAFPGIVVVIHRSISQVDVFKENTYEPLDSIHLPLKANPQDVAWDETSGVLSIASLHLSEIFRYDLTTKRFLSPIAAKAYADIEDGFPELVEFQRMGNKLFVLAQNISQLSWEPSGVSPKILEMGINQVLESASLRFKNPYHFAKSPVGNKVFIVSPGSPRWEKNDGGIEEFHVTNGRMVPFTTPVATREELGGYPFSLAMISDSEGVLILSEKGNIFGKTRLAHYSFATKHLRPLFPEASQFREAQWDDARDLLYVASLDPHSPSLWVVSPKEGWKVISKIDVHLPPSHFVLTR